MTTNDSSSKSSFPKKSLEKTKELANQVQETVVKPFWNYTNSRFQNFRKFLVAQYRKPSFHKKPLSKTKELANQVQETVVKPFGNYTKSRFQSSRQYIVGQYREPSFHKKPLEKTKKLANQAQEVVVKPFWNHTKPHFQSFNHYLLGQYRRIDIKNDYRQRRFVVATVVLFIVWLLLVGTLSLQEIFVGIMVAAFTALLSSKHLMFLDYFKISLATPWHVLRYLGVFVVALLRANIDMARRVLSPRLPINPALVKVQTQLKSPMGKLVLANSITLTPGTLTVDVMGDYLQVHWVDSTPGVDLEHATAAIAQSFERHIREFLA